MNVDPRDTTTMKHLRLIAVALVLIPCSAHAGWPFRQASSCPNGQCAAPTYSAATYAQPQFTYTYAQPVTYTYSYTYSTTDSYGFVGWLNSLRARYGLRAVAWSQDLATDAAANSGRGFGHFWFGRARRQNVGMGPLSSVQSMWLASPAHAAALLDPSITLVGLANVGGVWTYSAY